MAIIGNLSVGFRMDSKGLKKGAEEAAGMIKGFKGQVEGAHKALMGMAAAVGIAFAAGKLLEWGKAAMDAADNTGKAADRIGTSTENLIGFAHAASMSGSSMEEAVGAITKMNANLANAKGTENPFAQLGLDVEKLKASDPIEAVQQIADGINSLPNASEKARMAMDIFGKSGVNRSQLGSY